MGWMSPVLFSPSVARMTTFERAVLDFSQAYAQQNGDDYQRLVQAVASGSLDARTGL